MAGRILSKKKSDEIRRLAKLDLSKRQIAKALKVHRNTVTRYLISSDKADLAGSQDNSSWAKELDWSQITAEIARGVPATVIWEEQVELGKVPVNYSGFWKQLDKRITRTPSTMKRVFKPGERAEIDYCDGIDILDPLTGEIVKTQLFVGVLCYSRFAFAEFSLSQKLEDFLMSNRHMLEYFGGTPHILCPDNLKSAVSKSHKYDPVINEAYARFANYYDLAVVPARVRKPKDKAIVERTVQIFQRWFYYRVRKRTFTSLVELNQCLKEHLEIFNEKTHRVFRCSRKEMFLSEKEHLNALPELPYEVQTHHQASVHPDCHISFEKNYYSAPYQYRGKRVDLWVSKQCVEIYFEGERIAFHKRSHGHAHFITDKKHYPKNHQAYWDTNLKSIRTHASKLGPSTSKLVHELLSGKHPLQHLRRCQGIIRLSKKYSKKDLNRACELALFHNKPTYQLIERFLKIPGLMTRRPPKPIARNENPYLRGDDFFINEERKSDD